LLRESNAEVLHQDNLQLFLKTQNAHPTNKGWAGETMGFDSLSVRETKKQV